MTKGNMITVENSVRTVTKVDGPDGMGGNMGEGSGSLTTIKLTLDKAIPADVQVNQHVVENITYTPAVNISNCEFKEVPTRGILVTTRKPIVIENNTFDGMSMAGIYISDDAQGWYESGPVRDVTIRNNTFTIRLYLRKRPYILILRSRAIRFLRTIREFLMQRV